MDKCIHFFPMHILRSGKRNEKGAPISSRLSKSDRWFRRQREHFRCAFADAP